MSRADLVRCLHRLIPGAAAWWVFAGGSAAAQQAGAVPGAQIVDLDGRAVRVQILGLDNRRAGSPVVVFEAGATNSLEVWGSILPQVAAVAPVVAYDRVGLGRSEWDKVTPTVWAVRRVLSAVPTRP